MALAETLFLPGTVPDWHQPPHLLVPELRARATAEPVWNPGAVHFAVDFGPSNHLQAALLEQLTAALTDPKLGGSRVAVPNRFTPIDQVPNAIIMFGPGHLDAKLNTVRRYLLLPHPKPPFLLVNTADSIPQIDFTRARRQLVAGSCNNGVIFEGDEAGEHVSGTLWASMQGNHMGLRKSHQELLDDVTWRILAHYGTRYITQRENGPAPFTWADWAKSPIHFETATAAHQLGEAGVIQNRVELLQIYPDLLHVAGIEKALNKSLGESMRAQVDEKLRAMGVTVSGGGKIEVSPNPQDGDLVPVTQLTPTGYRVAVAPGSPVKYENGSVETHEAGKIALYSALALAGIARNFPAAEAWLAHQFAEYGSVDIIPDGLIPMITVIDHSHHHVAEYDPELIEVVQIDGRFYPQDLDFACGSQDAANATVSGFCHSDTFQNPGPPEDPLKGKIAVVVELGGHGIVVAGRDRQRVTEALTNDRIMKLKPPRWV